MTDSPSTVGYALTRYFESWCGFFECIGCFLGAIQFQARQLGKDEQGKKAVVHAQVHIGPPEDRAGLGLAVDLTVEGVDEELLQAAHQVSLQV